MFDVKVGSGLYENLDEIGNWRTMVSIMVLIKMVAVLSDMDQPLGRAVEMHWVTGPLIP